ncbi:MAG: glycosyltransferase family 2 protein [Planctomycetaceae bacterium]|nr:glycosyltransferase family 2 protein [Planctomycetaceae bacterium]
MKLSLVIPVYNEDESIVKLYEEIDAVVKQEQYETEIIFVDDGSTDSSWQKIEELHQKDTKISGIRFRRNFGKAAALTAGFEKASGDVVITMDADLQDDPKEIPGFLAMLEPQEDGKVLDVVSGWKKIRHDPWHKVIPSRFFNAMVSYMTGVKLHDHNCGMKCYRREIFNEITLYGELHRFVPVLAAARGYRVGEKVIAHRARTFGHSKYGFTRFIKGFLDLFTVWFLTAYGQRPQHLIGTLGLIASGIGAAVLIYLAGIWGISRLGLNWLTCLGLNEPVNIGHRPAVIYGVAALLFGAQLLSIGVIAEMLTSNRRSSAKDYSIKSTTGK